METEQKNSLAAPTIIFNEALSIYKKRFGVFVEVMLLPAVFVALANLFGRSNPILAIISIIIGLWGHISLIYTIKDSQENIDIFESFRRGRHKIISYLWVSFLVGIIMFGGFLLLIVPGFIFGLWFGFAPFILINEDLHDMKALHKSRDYTKGKLGSIAWRFLFLFLIIVAFAIVLGIILAILRVPFRDQISNFITNIFLTPLLVTYSFKLYLKLKELKEGAGQTAPIAGQIPT